MANTSAKVCDEQSPVPGNLPSGSMARLSSAAAALKAEYRIAVPLNRHPNNCRHVVPHSNQIFQKLVNMYSRIIKIQYGLFEDIVENTTRTTTFYNGRPVEYVAACYISTWFSSLYYLNYKSVDKVLPIALMEHYNTPALPVVLIQDKFDAYFSILASHIKPTPIKNSLDDAMYVPLICTHHSWDTDNPFNIEGFVLDYGVVRWFMCLISDKWITEPLSFDTFGRPSWLFDWHKDQAYAWFPEKGNFTLDDVAVAYIPGIPCSPNLGARDVDKWQWFPGGVLPATIPTVARRVTDCRFDGAAAYATLEIDHVDLREDPLIRDMLKTATSNQIPITSGAPSQQQEKGEDAQAAVFDVPPGGYRYRVVSLCYHVKVILELNEQ